MHGLAEDALSNWIADQILLEHSRNRHVFAHKTAAVLEGGMLAGDRAVGTFYSAVLFTEGIGVYMQQRWAEYL